MAAIPYGRTVMDMSWAYKVLMPADPIQEILDEEEADNG